MIIVTSHWNENLEWLKKSKWPVVLIDHEGSSKPCISPRAIIPNKGREASSYVRFMRDNYYHLPDYIVCLHGHENAWHHMHPYPILNLIRPANYLPLNGYWTDTDTQHKKVILKHWYIIEPWVGPIPAENGFLDGGAQFVVSRERIQRHPKKAYDYWYHMLTTSPEHFDIGIMFEFSWHYIFGEPWKINPRTLRFVG